MRFSRFLAIFLLAFALAAPGAMADQGKGKGKDKDKHSEKHKDKDKGRDWDRDRDDRDWDDDDHRVGNMRFQGMDRNGDGRISRREWRGNDVSFNNHDWNRNGVLSGDEVRPGGRDRDWDWDDDRDGRDDRWEDQFHRLDRNNDRYLSGAEWPGDLNLFDRIDLNEDGLLNLREIEQWRRDRLGRR
jgi:Ni/Co efflux regulator RcnB